MRKIIIASVILGFVCHFNPATGEEGSKVLHNPVVLDTCLVGHGLDERKLMLITQDLPKLPIIEVMAAINNPTPSNQRPGNLLFALVISRTDGSGAQLLWIAYDGISRNVMPHPVVSGVIAKSPISAEICVVVCISHGSRVSLTISMLDISKPIGEYSLDFLDEKDYSKWPKFEGKNFRPKGIEVTRGGAISWVSGIYFSKQIFIWTGGENKIGNREPLRLWHLDANMEVLTPIKLE